MYSLTSKRLLNECDGVLSASSHCYEGASLIQMEEWFKSFPQDPLPLYVIGPLLPPGCGRPSVEISASEKNQGERDVQLFLKEMQAKHGEKSVVFVGFFLAIGRMPQMFIIYFFQVSLGSVFWPADPGYIDEVIQGLIDKRAPFVRSFLSYSFAGPIAFICVAFKSDILPCISLFPTLRGIYKQCKIFRVRISDDLGARAIRFKPPGVEL